VIFNFKRRSHRRRLFNLFAFALLAFVIYLTVYHSEEEPPLQNSQSSSVTMTSTAQQGQ
jgi:hypothetical protein